MKHILSIGILLILSSCDQKAHKSDLHYPVEKVQDVMIDLYIAAEAIKDVNDLKKDSLLDLYRSQIEKIHEVDFDIIEKDIAIIRSNDEFYTEVHTVVNDSLNNIEQDWQAISSPDKIKTIPDKNSIRKSKRIKQMNKKSAK